MIQHFDSICNFRYENPVGQDKPIKSNDSRLSKVKEELQKLKKLLELKFSNFKGFDFTVDVSEGISYFPNILHICILPPEQKVSDGIYVGICFDKFGRGAVVGCMESKTNPKGLNTVTRKIKNRELRIDVDGANKNSKYNNLFENPREFFKNRTRENKFLAHIEKSLELCLYNLKLIKSSSYLQTSDLLNSEINENEIKYELLDDIKDERKKIAISINQRRGQKNFRKELLRAYSAKCCITGCDIVEILEAAHIYPYKGDSTNKTYNGLLMRTDIHTLFDLGLIAINPINYSVEVSDTIKDDNFYRVLEGKRVNLPREESDKPNPEYLHYHYDKIFHK